jgi:hypothetical protein
MRVLVACEFTGTVRRAFANRGHDAWSCDLLPAEDRSNKHIIGDVRAILTDGWDLLMVAHPPCTRLCNSGVRWLSVPPPGKTADQMQDELRDAAALFSACWNAPVPRIAIENPIMHRHAKALIRGYQPPAQFVQPWQFGTPQFKSIGLYLKGLWPLVATNPLTPPNPGTDEHIAWSRIHRMPASKRRSKERSRFFPAIAEAMADQWGGYALREAAA